MPDTLPPILPGAGAATGPQVSAGGWNRAQQVQLGRLNQQVDRDNAKVSMNQIVSGSAGNQKSTSVFHPGGMSPAASTSIAHAGEAHGSEAEDDARYNQGADDRRYRYAQKKIQERKAAEGGMKVGTGGAFGKKKFAKELQKTVSEHRADYKNISKQDRSFFERVVGKYAQNRSTGSGFDSSAKRRMRLEMDRARRAGTISSEDAKDFKNMIDSMQ